MTKMIRNFMVIVLSMFAVSMMGCSKDDVVIPQNQLPQNAQTFINTYFQDCTFAQAIKDGREYEVYFANGFEIDFDRNGEWESIDCKNVAVPTGIVPETIVNYVNQTFAQCFIVEISRDRHGYDVELNNGLDLDFDKNGNFIRIDD